jgi:hypothetical protein
MVALQNWPPAGLRDGVRLLSEKHPLILDLAMKSRNAVRLRRTTGAVSGRKKVTLQKKQHLQSTRQNAEVWVLVTDVQ